jgi:hypothetical protein
VRYITFMTLDPDVDGNGAGCGQVECKNLVHSVGVVTVLNTKWIVQVGWPGILSSKVSGMSA